MKIFNTFLLLIFCFFIEFLSANNFIEKKINFSNEEKEFIKKNPVIKFSDVKWQPFFDIKNKEHSGIFKEYYKLIEQRTGLKFKFVQIGDGVNFQLVLDALKNKQIDMIDGSGKTADRQKYAIFSEPLMKVSLSIVSNKLNRYTSVDGLENKTIALAKGSTAYEYSKEFLSKNKFILTNGIKEALTLVEEKKADILIDNVIVLDYLLKNGNYKDINISGIIDYDFKIYSLIRDDYRVLQSILNKAISSITKKELYEINNKLILSSLFTKKATVKFSPEEQNYIKNNTFKIGLLDNFYPFSFKEKNITSGFSYDLINLLVEKSGLKLEYIFDSWSNNINKLKNGDLDLIDGISYKSTREKFVNFSQTYYEIPNVIFSKSDKFKDFKDLNSLKGKRVGITKGIYYYDDLKKLNLFNIVEFEDSREKMKALAYDKVDAIFNNLVSGQKYIKENAYNDIIILDEIKTEFIKKEDLRIGVNKKDELLFSIINKTFDSITFEEKNSLINKWFYKTKDSEKIDLSQDELSYLKKKKSISLCIDPSWMPLEKIEKGKHIGLSADYMNMFSKWLKTPIVLKETKTWIESMEKIKNKECDILSLVSKTDDRSSFLNFTSAYINTQIVIASKNTVPYNDNIKQLSGKKFGIVKGYSLLEEFKEKYKNIIIIEVDSIEDGLKKVNNGELFGYIDNSYVINHNIQNNYLGILNISGKFDDSVNLSIGIRSDEDLLLSIFQKAVNSIDEVSKQRILNNWVNLNFKKVIDYDLLFKILALISFVLLFLLYRHLSIKKMNKELKERVKEELAKSRGKDKLLFHQNKMVSMGQMIENIAHQWRQPLSQINSSVLVIDNILMDYNINDKNLESKLNEIESMTKYMSTIIDDFTGFTSQNADEKNFNLKNAIEKSLLIMKGSFEKKNIKVDLFLDEKIDYYGYENYLCQVLVVLFNNARDAFLLRNITKPKITVILNKIDEKIKLIVKDNAGGIPKEIIENVFEPYFTTKHKSQGTGLGLYISKKIIEDNMKGLISIENDKNGANIIIELDAKDKNERV